MFYINKKLIARWVGLALFILLFVTGCSGGVQSGSSSTGFGGLSGAEAISPTAVKLSWESDPSVTTYQIYDSSSSSPLNETVFDQATIEGLEPNKTYVFKVLGVTAEGSLGSGRELSVKTWPRFTGVGTATIQNNATTLTWSYPYPALAFEVFYRKSSAPDSASTSAWASPNLTTQGQTVTIEGLDSSSTYYFIVQAAYRESEKEITSNSVTVTTASGFQTPEYSLSEFSIGSLPSLNFNPINEPNYLPERFTSQVFWNNSPVSDPLQGPGTINFSPTSNLPLGKVENLTLQINYSDGNRTDSMTINGLTTYIKGSTPWVEEPPMGGLPLGAAYMGTALARGDFNCDGADDIAVGLPDVAIAPFGVRRSRAGAVYIYYSKKLPNGRYEVVANPKPVPNPINKGVDPQVLTFSDLDESARFGYSLSAGNLNRDRRSLPDYPFIAPCDDLLVGAPYQTNTGLGKTGAAFVFFGSPTGINAPAAMRDMPVNIESCDGRVENAACTSVRLVPNSPAWPSSVLGGTYAATSTYYEHQFGYSVSFIGDFNADGFEDIAIGAPGAPWDGVLPSTAGDIVHNVGYVGIFFGSKFGLGSEDPETTSLPQASSKRFRFLKIFSPVPQIGARFGQAVHGGADVDGDYKVRIPGEGLVGGADLVVGAPNFRYNNFTDPIVNQLGANVGSTFNSSIMDLSSRGWVAGGLNLLSPTSYHGIPQDEAERGIAFLFFGRSSPVPVGESGPVETPSRKSFWSCGHRGMNSTTQHYSCLAGGTKFKALTPRNGWSTKFGSAVQIVGDPSRFLDGTNTLRNAEVAPLTPLQYFSDPNGDGFAEVFVAASGADPTGRADAGVIWQFFGNPLRLYEASELSNLNSSNATNDSQTNIPSCTSWAIDSASVRLACAPTILNSPSVTAGSRIGDTQNQISSGDVTGDGIKELAIGATGDSTLGTNSGAVLIFNSVKAAGANSNFRKVYSSSLDADDQFGASVVIGNFNGDLNSLPGTGTVTVSTPMPFNDVVVGAPRDEASRPGGGSLFGFLTNGASFAALESTEDAPFPIYDQSASFQEFGYDSIRIVGDINGDGYDDAVGKVSIYLSNGSLRTDAVVYFGSKLGLITTSTCLENATQIFKTGSMSAASCYPSTTPVVGLTENGISLPQLIARPANLSGQWARFAYGVGDINGDGFADVMFSNTRDTTRQHVVYYGARGGLQNIVNPSWQPAVNDPQIVTTQFALQEAGFANVGTSEYMAGIETKVIAGDFNNDGYSDIAMSDPDAASPAMNVAGSPWIAGDIGSDVTPGTGWKCTGSAVPPECATGSAIGRWGRVIVFYGSRVGVQTPSLMGLVAAGSDISLTDSNQTHLIYGPKFSSGVPIAQMGTENALDTKACDTATPVQNCKATLIENPVFENIDRGWERLSEHYFGASTAVVDVDNDGYDDLLIGAPGFEDMSCHEASVPRKNYGRVYIYKGSARGLVAGPRRAYYRDALGLGCPLDRLPTSEYDPGLGLRAAQDKVRAVSPTLEPYSTAISQNVTDRGFGARLSAAGDVNGDGFEDFVVGTNVEAMPGLGNSGAFYIYYGPLCRADNEATINAFWQEFVSSPIRVNRQTYLDYPPAAASGMNINSPPGFTTADCNRGGTLGNKPLPQKFVVLDSDTSRADVFNRPIVSGRKGQADFNADGFDDILVGSSGSTDRSTDVVGVGRAVLFFGHSTGLYSDDLPALSVSPDSLGRLKPFDLTPTIKNTDIRWFRGNMSLGDVNNDGAADILVPTRFYNGSGDFEGVAVGTFFIFQ